MYKVKPKLPNQFKAVDNSQIPFSVILGEDEIAQGKVKIKENGLRPDHPEKEGILVDLEDLVPEIQKRIERRVNLDALVKQADGLRVVGGIKNAEVDASVISEAPTQQPTDAKIEEAPTTS